MRRLGASVVALTPLALASKDSNYYSNGRHNPNMKKKLYWRDAPNILADLSEFQTLYITEKNCAWSSYTDEDGNNACGVDDADDRYWYLEYAECNRANVAYALYGVLKGDTDKGCQSSSFINSFFTTGGIESFTETLASIGYQFDGSDNDMNDEQAVGYQITSDCVAGKTDYGDDKAGDYTYHTRMSAGYTSYAVGCSRGAYVQKSFKSAYCQESAQSTIVESMEQFNADMRSAKCVKIYDSSSGATDGLSLLYNSRSCSVHESKQCPDPYGKVAEYSRNLQMSSKSANNNTLESIKATLSWSILMVGTATAFISLVVLRKLRRQTNSSFKKSSKETAGFKKGIFRKLGERLRLSRSLISRAPKGGNEEIA